MKEKTADEIGTRKYNIMINKSEAMIIDGKFNLKSIMTKILSDMSYKFYNIEIIEVGE